MGKLFHSHSMPLIANSNAVPENPKSSQIKKRHLIMPFFEKALNKL